MKIVIADDHAVVRTGFSMILNYQEDMEVVATAADGVEAYQKSVRTSTRCFNFRFEHAARRVRLNRNQ